MSAFRRAATIAAATSVVLLGAAGAASAQTLSVRDAHHDVWQTADGGQTFTAAPKQVAADLQGVTVRYGSKNLVVTERFANLTKRGMGDVYSVTFGTNTGLRRVALVKAARYHWGGTVEWDSPRKNSAGLTCDGLSEHIDYGRDTVRISVPATCLKNPRWVQFVAVNLHVKSPTLWLIDNSSNALAKPHSPSGKVRRG